MPFSDQSNRAWIVDRIAELPITSMLDVGAGAGTYGRLFAEQFPRVRRTAVEVWKPYIYTYDLFDVYRTIHHCDVRDHEDFAHDIVIFGDILEHMTKGDALLVWDKVRRQAKSALIAIPIVHYPQGEYEGNPYEEHVKDDWSHAEVLETFPEIVAHQTSGLVGSYLAIF